MPNLNGAMRLSRIPSNPTVISQQRYKYYSNPASEVEEPPVTCNSTKTSSLPAANPRGLNGTSGYWTHGAQFQLVHFVITRVTK